MSDAKLYHQTPKGQVLACNAKQGRCPYSADVHMSLTLDELVAKREAIAGKDMNGVVPARARKPSGPVAYGPVRQPGETMTKTDWGWRYTRADGSYREVDESGESFYNRRGLRHRENAPAVVWADGSMEFWAHGGRHNEDGPAVVCKERQEWWLNGSLHRKGGPAVVRADGRQEWWLDHRRHRLDGPAVVHPDGRIEFWDDTQRVG